VSEQFPNGTSAQYRLFTVIQLQVEEEWKTHSKSIKQNN